VCRDLIKEEAEAHAHLGDLRWLMGLSDPAEEEARVIEGVSRHEPAESILQRPPAKQQLSLLEQLMAGARTPAARASAATSAATRRPSCASAPAWPGTIEASSWSG
jgi:hypothetical protein